MSPEIFCNILNFLMGMLTMYVLRLGFVRYRGNRPMPKITIPKIDRRITLGLAIVLIILGSLFVGIQSYQTDRDIRDLTLETQQCYREFATGIEANRKLARENEMLSRQQRTALADTQGALYIWLNKLLNPPPDIALLPTTDQRRRDYNLTISHEFNQTLSQNSKIIADSRAQELVNDEERKQHPLPEPTCGLE
jgi:hypothetical protein